MTNPPNNTLETELFKLSPVERAVIEALRSGSPEDVGTAFADAMREHAGLSRAATPQRDPAPFEHKPYLSTHHHVFAVTTDADDLRGTLALEDANPGRLADQFRKAWRMFGNLVYSGTIDVSFSDPDWSRRVMHIVEDMTEDLTGMDY